MVSSVLRLAPSAEGVSIWSTEIFGGPGASRVRDFISRAFAVPEVANVEVQRENAFGRINYGEVADPAQVWKKLSRAISRPESASRIDTEFLYLDVPSARRIRVSRIGKTLSTWRVRSQSENKLRVAHPLLRNRGDLVFRLEEELASLAGIEAFRASVITGTVSVRFDKVALSAEQLARALERAWPRLLEGTEKPLSRKRFFASVGLVGLSFTGQYLIPPLRPLGVAGVALNGIPNVIQAAKDLTRGQVGLPALYSTGLAFTVASGMPFASSVIGALGQFWPQLAQRKFTRTRRRLIVREHSRATWARVVGANGTEVDVHVESLRAGDRVSVRRGETVPAPGIVESGAATVVNGTLFGSDPIENRWRGDTVDAGAFVREGELTLRVERSGPALSVHDVISLLPYSSLEALPSPQEAERVANRNAKPTLALSAASLVATRTLRPSQVLIRPDYATGPRLSARLSILNGVGSGLQRGILFKNPAALDRLNSIGVYVLDDTADLGRKRTEVATIHPVNGTPADLIVAYVLAAQPHHSEHARALQAYGAARKITPAKVDKIRREPGVVHFRDGTGQTIAVASARYLASADVKVPKSVRAVAAEVVGDSPALSPLAVLRNDEVIGVVSFARSGDSIAKQVVAAIKAANPKARIVHLSRKPQADAEALARELGIAHAWGGLSQSAKLERIRGFDANTLWIGDGSDTAAFEAIAASTLSVSVAPLSHTRPDRADVLVPQRGLEGVPEALELARAHKARIARDYRTVYAVNLLGVTGVFSPRVTSLHAGLLSNAGIALIYAQHVWDLNRLAALAEAKRSSSRSTPVR
jgi:cation transport ATPase